MTLRRRVLGYLVLAAAASCLLTFAIGLVLVRHRVVAQRLSNLEAQAGLLALVGGAPGALAAGQHVYAVGARGPRQVRPLARDLILAAIPTAGDGQGQIAVAGRELLYAARLTPTGRVVLVRRAQLAFAEWRPFLTSLGLASLGGVLLAVALSSLLARRLTRPLRALAEATRRVGRGESPVQVPVEGDDELAELARAFNRMSLELGQARDSQQRFLESVSHDLKTPLTSIRGYGEALEERALPPEEAGRVIVAESDRLGRLVGDLLDLGRLGRAGFSVRREPVDLAAQAAAAVDRHLPWARELGVALSAVHDEAAWALGDPDRLLQAISNLIENALRLTPEGGAVTVEARPGLVAVSDTGPGLAEEDLPRAFERFYLHGRYRSERPVGSGLGLAIVAELIGAMGGEARALRAPGGGARFELRLPVSGPAPAPAGVAGGRSAGR